MHRARGSRLAVLVEAQVRATPGSYTAPIDWAGEGGYGGRARDAVPTTPACPAASRCSRPTVTTAVTTVHASQWAGPRQTCAALTWLFHEGCTLPRAALVDNTRRSQVMIVSINTCADCLLSSCNQFSFHAARCVRISEMHVSLVSQSTKLRAQQGPNRHHKIQPG